MRVIITAATVGEWMPAFLSMDKRYTSESSRLKVQFHQGGVGMLATAFSLMKMIAEEKPDLVIQAGIAGCFDANAPLGHTIAVKEEMLADMGVQEDGKWRDLFDLQLEKSSYPPFERRKLPNPWLGRFNLLKLPEVRAVTINQITTGEERIRQIVKKYDPFAESMEGAVLHYVCRQTDTPFLQIRSISNYVGERNKAHWKIKEAIDNLNQVLIHYVEQLYNLP